jgi:HlyD family secretion protein
MTTPGTTSTASVRDRRRAQKQRRRRRQLLGMLLVAVLGGAAGGAWWWFELRAPAAEAVVGPTYRAVALAPYVATVPAPGSLRAVATAEVRAGTAGDVLWTAAVGARPVAGEVVARLDATDLERDVRDAELALERAERARTNARSDRADLERSLTLALDEAEERLDRAREDASDAEAQLDLTRRLAAIGSASAREVADAEAAASAAGDDVATAERDVATARSDLATRVAAADRDLEDAIASVEQAVDQLGRAQEALIGAELRAPIDGVVSEVRVAAGGYVAGNGTVLSLADDRRVELVAQVDESEISSIALGQSATVAVAALGDRTFPSEVTAVAPVAQTNQNIPVFEIVLTIDNADGALRPGMTGEAEVTVRRVEDTVTLPAAAVGTTPRGGVVTVRLEDGSTERRPVEVVATVGATTVVRGDLPEGLEVEVPGTTTATAGVASGATAAPANGLPLPGIPGVTPRGEFPGGGAGGGARGGQ